jgi:hypothetical protein
MQTTNVLKQVDIFYNFTPMEIELVAALCEEQLPRVKSFAEARPTSCISSRGEVEILLDFALVGQTLNAAVTDAHRHLRDGQIFGEVALVDWACARRRRALHSDTHLLRIPHDTDGVVTPTRSLATADAQPGGRPRTQDPQHRHQMRAPLLRSLTACGTRTSDAHTTR